MKSRMLPWQSTTHFLTKYARALLFALAILVLIVKNESVASTLAYFSAHDITTGLLMRTGEWIPEVTIEIVDDGDMDSDDCKDKSSGHNSDKHESKCSEGHQDNHGDDKDKQGGGSVKADGHKDDGGNVENKNDEGNKKDEKNSLCIHLFASLPDTDIYYEFSNDGNPLDGGVKYDDMIQCLTIPKDSHFLQAQAVRKQNDTWKSDVKMVDVSSVHKDDDEGDDENSRGKDKYKHKD